MNNLVVIKTHFYLSRCVHYVLNTHDIEVHLFLPMECSISALLFLTDGKPRFSHALFKGSSVNACMMIDYGQIYEAFGSIRVIIIDEHIYL